MARPMAAPPEIEHRSELRENASVAGKAAKLLLWSLLVAPGMGAAVGALVGVIALRDPSILVGGGMGAVFGASTGLAFGISVAWSLGDCDLLIAVESLFGFTLIFALPVALLPVEAAPPLSWGAGILGFWVGFSRLRDEQFRRRISGGSSIELQRPDRWG
jgi:hypothetical protein